MTGWNEAKTWLAENAPEWRLANAESRLTAGSTIGAPTATRSEVTLVESLPGEDFREGPWLKGEGETILAAVQNAVGGLR